MAKPKKKKSLRVDVYQEPDNRICPELAKELLGWEYCEEDDLDKKIRDWNGLWVKLSKNSRNRPFRRVLAMRYADEMLKGRWSLNGESITRDWDEYIQSGQHRLIGLVFAQQKLDQLFEWERMEGVGPDDRAILARWKTGNISIEGIVVTGINPDPKITDTIDLGQRRTLGDVLFRDKRFGDVPDSRMKVLAQALAQAVRLVYMRSHGKRVTDSIYLPHSELIEFLEEHPMIVDSVTAINEYDGGGGIDGNRISHFISLGNAAGLMYLMGMSYDENAVPEDCEHILMFKAKEFWKGFADGADLPQGSPILELTRAVMAIPAEGGTEEMVGTFIKAWNIWIDDKTVKRGGLRLQRRRDSEDKLVIVEYPTLGGLDCYEG